MVGALEEERLNFKNPASNLGSCVLLLGSADTEGTVAHILDSIYGILKVVAVIWAIISTFMDLIQVISRGKNKDELMVAVRKTGIRLVLLLVFLLLPTVIDIIGNIMGIDDVLCGIK